MARKNNWNGLCLVLLFTGFFVTAFLRMTEGRAAQRHSKKPAAGKPVADFVLSL